MGHTELEPSALADVKKGNRGSFRFYFAPLSVSVRMTTQCISRKDR
jgi:hypothetical protein